MPKEVVLNFAKLFADDCKLYGTVNRAINCMQTDLNNLEECSNKWQLPFNESKCKVLHFGHNNEKRDYTTNDHRLEAIRLERDLRVIVDDELKFHMHTATATKKSNQILGIIKNSYQTRDAVTISTLYKAMVRPHLEYANSIWGPFYKCGIKKAEAVQHRATKLIPELKDKPYEDRLKALQLPSLTYRRKRKDMIQMYKIMNKLVRIQMNKIMNKLVRIQMNKIMNKLVRIQMNKIMNKLVRIQMYKIMNKLVRVQMYKIMNKLVRVQMYKIMNKLVRIQMNKIMNKLVRIQMYKIMNKLVRVQMYKIMNKLVRIQMYKIMNKLVRIQMYKIMNKLVRVQMYKIMNKLVRIQMYKIMNKLVRIQMYKIMNKLVRIGAEKLFARGHNQRVFKTHASFAFHNQ